MKESSVQQRIRLAAADMGIELWRNNSGACQDLTGRLIRYGLANESKALNEAIKSSDLIGILPEDVQIVGRGLVRIGVFLAIECKPTGWIFQVDDKRATAQAKFHDIVRSAGGVAGFATSVEDFRKIIRR